MNDFENNFEQYLKHLDLFQKNEPEKYKFIKEIADEFKDIDLSKLIENIALSFETNKKRFSELTGKSIKEVFLKEQIELYTYANHRFNRFGDYANEMFNKYQPVFIEALGYWKTEFQNLKALPPQPISVNESRTKKVIFETITNIDKQGWQYAFVSETDYNLFTDLLTNFFEYKPYTLPETIIQLKRTCKTKVAKALGEIHKELSNENKLSTDTKYFQLIRVLSHFEKETEGDLYKALTR